MPKTLLLTGGAGFIGHHTVEEFLKNTDWDIVVLDRLSYAGNLNFLADLDCWEAERRRVHFIYHDLRAAVSDTTIHLLPKIDYIIHMAAETHVDRSIEDARPFVESNVIGTLNLLELAQKLIQCQRALKKVIYVSTDEVYGGAVDGHLHKEGEPFRPSNPYSASKAGAEALCYSFWNTHYVPVLISNTMNNFGERQNPEKFIPKTLTRLLKGDTVYCHAKIVNEKVEDVSSRCWLHARNHANGLRFLLEHGNPGESYNITGEKRYVDEIAMQIADYAKVPHYEIRYKDFHSFRPGHDMHYGLDGTKMANMGWVRPLSLAESLEKTIHWMQAHPRWLGMGIDGT
jgi:dTDP-glucose 4,6-dehydratase